MKLIKLSKLLCALSLALGLINAVPIASETTSHQLILTTREDFANARRKAFLAFKNQWNPFTQIIKADFVELNGTRTFFRVNAEDNAGAYQAFVLQDEAPAGVSVNVTQELVDYSAYDLQTEKRVTIRSRKVDGFYREKESTCNRIMGARVHDYFKSNYVAGSNWIVLKYNVTSPTALQILERGRVNLPEHLSPPKLYTRAAHQLNRLHKNYRSHGDINLSNFKVDEATGTVNLINFMKCQEAFYVSPEYEVLMKPIVKEENKKVWRLFSAYMSNDEIEEIKREEEEKKKEDRLAEY